MRTGWKTANFLEHLGSIEARKERGRLHGGHWLREDGSEQGQVSAGQEEEEKIIACAGAKPVLVEIEESGK